MNKALPWTPEPSSGQPLVSVILFCRNAEKTLRRSIESLAGQTYKNFEYVVQDAASTDGTLDIIKSYADRLSIRLVSAPDAGPADGFWRAIQRCQGDIVATCLADEELMPDALESAARIFNERPYLGAITGDAFVTDASGNTLSTHKGEPFSFARYLAGEYCPYWSSSFFSMQALRTVGLFQSRWSADSLEFEIWCRLAEDYEILYTPKILSKYAIHPEQLSNQGIRALTELNSRSTIIREHVFRRDGVFGEEAFMWRDRCIFLQQINLLQHLIAYKRPEAEVLAKKIGSSPMMSDLASGLAPHNAMSYDAIVAAVYGRGPLRYYRYALALLYRSIVPTYIRARITPEQKARLRRLLGMPRTL